MTEHICEVCEKPTVDPIFDDEHGLAFCGPCAVSLIGAERDHYRDAIRSHRDGWIRANGDRNLAGNARPADFELWKALTIESTDGEIPRDQSCVVCASDAKRTEAMMRREGIDGALIASIAPKIRCSEHFGKSFGT